MTRFSDTVELHDIAKIYNQAVEKRKDLKLGANQNGVASLEYDKYRVFDERLKNIEGLVIAFNEKPVPKNKKEELIEVKKLLSGIISEVLSISIKDMESLITPRNSFRYVADQFFKLTSSFGGGAVGAILFGPVGALTFFFTGKLFSNVVSAKTGLNSNIPASGEIMLDFATQLYITLRVLTDSTMDKQFSYVKAEKIKFTNNCKHNIPCGEANFYIDDAKLYCAYRDPKTLKIEKINLFENLNAEDLKYYESKKDSVYTPQAAAIVAIQQFILKPFIMNLKEDNTKEEIAYISIPA